MGEAARDTGHKTLLSLETFTGRRRWRFVEVDLCVGSIIIVIASTIIDVQGNVRTQTFKEIHIYVKHHTIKKLINIYVNIFVG